MKKGVDKMEWMRYNNKRARRGVAQFGRVLGLGPRCRRFKSCRLDHKKFSANIDIGFDVCYNEQAVSTTCWCSSVGRAADL